MNVTEVRRPIMVWIAVVASLLAFMVGQYLMRERTAQAMPMFPPAIMTVVFIFSFALLAALLYFVFQGYNWARITFLVVIFLRSFSMLSRLSHGVPHINASIEVVHVAIELFSVCLLFTPPSNRWFKRLQQSA